MLTKLTIRNFKRFTTAEIELGNPVVFVGPNNSGKTTALQAIALWDVGLRRSKKNGDEGATINRNDLFAVPTPNANLLWNDLHVKDVHIEIAVEGVTADRPWTCGLRFEYANEESLILPAAAEHTNAAGSVWPTGSFCFVSIFNGSRRASTSGGTISGGNSLLCP